MHHTWDEVLASKAGMRPEDWFILRCRPTFEDIASDHITKWIRGSDVYFPVAKGKRPVKRPRVERETEAYERAAFPGYLYCRFDTIPNWSILEICQRASPRLWMLMSSDGSTLEPVWARAAEVELVRKAEAAAEYNDAQENPYVKKLRGKMCRIPSGVFMGMKGKIHSVIDDVVKVKIKVMQGKTAFLSFTLQEILENAI